MATYRSRIDWHDLRIAPDDIPEEDEEVLITKENYEGARKVVAGARVRELTNGTYAWYIYIRDYETHKMEEAMIWDEVVAWAYYPDPHIEM